jgi:hypothetical protein
MAWTSGDFDGRLTAKATVAFVFGEKITRQQLVDAVRDGNVVYAAVRCKGTDRVWGIVFIVRREGSRLHVKPISEHLGPFDDRCPARILDLLSEARTEEARNWRARCRTREQRERRWVKPTLGTASRSGPESPPLFASSRARSPRFAKLGSEDGP